MQASLPCMDALLTTMRVELGRQQRVRQVTKISIFQNLVNPIKVVNIITIMAMPFGKRQT